MLRGFVVTLFLALSVASAQALEDTPENRTAQVDRYLQAVSPQAMFEDMTSKMAQGMPEAQRDAFTALATRHMNFGNLTTAMRAAMVKTFTADELAALADFYSMPTGKSAMAKMGTYMAEVMPAMTAEMTRAMQAAMQEMQQKQPK